MRHDDLRMVPKEKKWTWWDDDCWWWYQEQKMLMMMIALLLLLYVQLYKVEKWRGSCQKKGRWHLLYTIVSCHVPVPRFLDERPRLGWHHKRHIGHPRIQGGEAGRGAIALSSISRAEGESHATECYTKMIKWDALYLRSYWIPYSLTRSSLIHSLSFRNAFSCPSLHSWCHSYFHCTRRYQA